MKNTRHLIIGLIIAISAGYFTFRNISWDEFVASFVEVNYIYLVPAVATTILSFITRAYRWKELLQPLKQVQVGKLFSPLMVGYMGNLLPARAGEVLRAWLVGKQCDIPFSGAFATIVIERIFDLIMLLFLFIWLLLFKAHIFNSEIEWGGVSLSDIAFNFGVLGAALIIVLLTVIYLMRSHRKRVVKFVQWIFCLFPKKWNNSVDSFLEKFGEGLRVVGDFKALGKVALWSGLTWFLMTLSYYPLYWAYDLTNKSIDSLVLLIVMICIFISAFPTPGFIGSFHASIIIALHQILGEPEVVVASFSMVAWALNMVIIVAGGVYFILREHLSIKQLAKVKQGT